MYYFLIFNAFSVYFASQCLQQSSFIDPKSHDPITQFNITYNALYSILLVLGLHQLQSIELKNKRDKILYTLTCHAGAIIFGLAGEYGPLQGFALTPGFWRRLPPEGKLIVVAIAALIAVLVIWQGIRAKKRRSCQKQWFPWMCVFITWFILWVTLLKDHKYVHVHHALFAGFFSCWFSDFTSLLDIIVNAFLTGIVIEGIDFYGIGELTLFILKENAQIYSVGVQAAWLLSILGVGIVIWKSESFKE